MADDQSTPQQITSQVDAQVDEKLDDDEPVRLQEGLPPEIASPLAPFNGQKPPSPAWFDAAIAKEPERRLIPVEGANIELLTWGEVGKPGLDPGAWATAPMPTGGASSPPSGRGLPRRGPVRSPAWADRPGGRPTPSETFAAEIWECAKAAGLYDALRQADLHRPLLRRGLAGRPGLGGHVPGADARRCCSTPASAARRPPSRRKSGASEAEKQGGRRGLQPAAPHPAKPGLCDAGRGAHPLPLSCRLQVPGNLFIADFIARRSLRRAAMPDGSGEGWTWKFDPLHGRASSTALRCRSWIAARRRRWRRSLATAPRPSCAGAEMARPGRAELLPEGVPSSAIPDSEHYIETDQPCPALVAALRALLSAWPA